MHHILVVDDSDVDRMMIESLLNNRGFVCIAAEHGLQALEKLKEWSIDVVLTDLNMPRMDGLQLVKAMRKEYPKIPVILTTGMGSEETAAEALSLGATSYIPKHKLTDMLLQSVQRVLDILDESTLPKQLDGCTKGAHFEFELGNDPERLRGLVEFIEKTLRTLSPLDRNDRLRIAMAVDQALHNALYRGNLEIDSEYKVPFIERYSDQATAELVDKRMFSKPYSDRKIQVVIDMKPTRFAIRIRDGGPGFDPKKRGTWENPDERGVILMRAFMDKVEYDKTGNDVQLCYYYEQSEQDQTRGQKLPKTESPAGSVSVAKSAQLTCLNTGAIVPLDKRKLVVGTRSECHVRLNAAGNVAPLHCMFVPEGPTWNVVQISPQFQTLVNMKPVAGRERLNVGDVVSIGSFEFKFG